MDEISDKLAERRWSLLFPILGFLAGIILSGIGLSFAKALFPHSISRANGSIAVPSEVGSFIGLWLGFLGSVVLSSRIVGTKNIIKDFGFKVKVATDLPIGLFVGLASQVVFGWLIYYPFERLDKSLSTSLSKPANQLAGGVHGIDAVIIAIFLTIFAPIVEELFFRGLLLNSFQTIFKNVKRFELSYSAIFTGVFFGLAHGEWLQLPGLVLFGILLSAMKLKTKRLGMSIFAHIAFNAVSVYFLMVQR